MKLTINKLILFTYLILTSSLYGTIIKDNKTFIFKTKVFSTIKTNFAVTLKNKQSHPIEKSFKDLISIVKTDGFCTGGKYNILPSHYDYNGKYNKDITYKGWIGFECQFQDIKKYEILINKVKQINPAFDISQNKLNYTLSSNQKEIIKNKLVNMAIKYAKNYSEKLNNNFDNCKIKLIDLTSNNYNHFRTTNIMMMKSANNKTTVTAPIQNNIEQSLFVKYEFECKDK